MHQFFIHIIIIPNWHFKFLTCYTSFWNQCLRITLLLVKFNLRHSRLTWTIIWRLCTTCTTSLLTKLLYNNLMDLYFWNYNFSLYKFVHFCISEKEWNRAILFCYFAPVYRIPTTFVFPYILLMYICLV